MAKKAILLIFLCVAISTIAGDQNWNEYSVTLKRPGGYSFHLVSEAKYRSWDLNDGVFKKNWVFGVGKKLNHGFSLSFSYKQELTRKFDGNDIVERRPFVDIGWKKGISENTSFDFRFRTEANQYIHESKKDRYTFRFRFRLTGKTKLLGIDLEPYIAIEPFYDTISDSFQKYRLYTGAMIPIVAHSKLRIAYIRQDVQGKTPDNVFNTGLSFTF